MLVQWLLHAVLVVPHLCTQGQTTKDGTQIKTDIYFTNFCKSEKGKFASLLGLSMEQCVQEYGLRKHCVGLNYKRRANVCVLLSSEGNVVSNTTGCIHVSASDIEAIQKPCTECAYGQVCVTTTGQCRFKECLATVKNGRMPGNVFTIGAVTRYKCNGGYTETSGLRYATCLPSGQWSAAANCEIDCYAGESWEYTGKKNVTETGTQCQRWDSQTPRDHTFTNVSAYPETSLSEAENYCRNPSYYEYGLWCYTSDVSKPRWELCGIPEC